MPGPPPGVQDGLKLKSPNPEGARWPKGTVLNPTGKGGMQKGMRSRNPLGRDRWPMTRALMKVLRQKHGCGERGDVAIARVLVDQAVQGNMDAIVFIYDRLEGKVTNKQETQMTLQGGETPLILDTYIQDNVLASDAVRALAHSMLSQIVAAGEQELPEKVVDAASRALERQEASTNGKEH